MPGVFLGNQGNETSQNGALARIPIRRRPGSAPVGGSLGQLIQDIAHAFSSQLQPIELAHSGKDVGGIGPLTTASFEQTTRLEGLHQRCE
jgi:hypothetical protein